MPLRWAAADCGYVKTIWQQRDRSTTRQKVNPGITYLLIMTTYAASWPLCFGPEATLYWLLPSRLALTWPAFAFNYLLHHPHNDLQSHNL